MLHVVLDTNAVGVRRPMAGNANELALEESRAGRIRLVVPELVLREAVNSWAEGVKTADRQRHQAHDDLRRRGAVTSRGPSRLDIDELRESEERRLRELLADAQADVLPFPEVAHERVVRRALERRRPFDSGGKDGYRDSLLWETVLALGREGQEVLLISSDAKAFADPQSDGALHESLLREAEVECGRANPVTLALDMRTAMESLAESSDEILKAVDELFNDNEFWEDFSGRLDAAVVGIPVPSALAEQLATSGPVISARLNSAPDFDEVTVLYGRRAASGQALVELGVRGPASVSVTFRADDFSALASTMALGALTLEDDETAATGELWCEVGLRLDLVVNVEEQRLVSVIVSDLTSLVSL